MDKTTLHDDPVIKRFLSLISPLMKDINSVYLFGSRCRDDWRPDSDYDILIVIRDKDRRLIDRLYDNIMDILLDTGRLVSLKIFAEKEFNRLNSIPTPFMQNVMKEGVKIAASS